MARSAARLHRAVVSREGSILRLVRNKWRVPHRHFRKVGASCRKGPSLSKHNQELWANYRAALSLAAAEDRRVRLALPDRSFRNLLRHHEGVLAVEVDAVVVAVEVVEVAEDVSPEDPDLQASHAAQLSTARHGLPPLPTHLRNRD